MIQFDKVSKRYGDGTYGLKDLDLKIEQGEFVSVIGRSGAGKSTFLRLVNGTIAPTEGKVSAFGHHLGAPGEVGACSPRELREVRRETGFVFQQFNLIKTHTVLSNVLMGRLGYMSAWRGALGLFSDSDRKTALDVLAEVGLKEQVHKRVDQISGGQQQRVAIARALIQHPKVILADEPMASLDPKLSEVVLDLLYQFNQERRITVLVNVHVIELAKRRSTRIIGLKRGKLVFDGTPAQLTQERINEVYSD